MAAAEASLAAHAQPTGLFLVEFGRRKIDPCGLPFLCKCNPNITARNLDGIWIGTPAQQMVSSDLPVGNARNWALLGFGAFLVIPIYHDPLHLYCNGGAPCSPRDMWGSSGAIGVLG